MLLSYQSPVGQALVVSGWADDRSYRGEGAKHEGLDFSVKTGTPVYSSQVGVVKTSKNAAPDPGGEIISVQHPDGLYTYYMHLSQRLVKAGDRVSKGQLIAYSGSSGIKQSAAHLHYAIRANSSALAEFKLRYGTPRGGYPAPKAGGVTPVPSESLIPANYSDKVKASARANGIPIEAGMSGAVALLLIGGAYFIWKRT